MTDPQSKEHRFASHLERMRLYWPQAWISEEPNAEGLHLICLPGYLLCSGWNATICTVLWLAQLDNRREAGVISHFNAFWVDLPDLRVDRWKHPQYSRGTYQLHWGGWSTVPIEGFPHWKDLTRFWWKAQMGNPNLDTIATHFNIIRQRLKPAR